MKTSQKDEFSLRMRIAVAGVVGGLAAVVGIILSPVIGTIAACVVAGVTVGVGARVFLKRKFHWSLRPWATWLFRPTPNKPGDDG